MEIFKRGRNGAHHNYRKNLNFAEYNDSTGFEAIIGYLFLKQDFERLNEIICLSIKAIEESEQ
jgi:ribonuclease-3 family protein